MDKERLETFLQEIATETAAILDVLKNSDELLLSSPHWIKSCKYSLIVISEAIANTLQHILAQKYHTAVSGYTEVFIKAKQFKILSDDLLGRLQPFIRFRNILVHQYWRIDDTIFLSNLRSGIPDFREFIYDIKKFIDG